MVDILGQMYYVDFKELNKFLMSDESFLSGTTEEIENTEIFNEEGNILTTSKVVTTKEKPREINVVRYDIIRGFIDDIGAQDDEEDSALGANNLTKMSVRFKIAFNTLDYYNILKIAE